MSQTTIFRASIRAGIRAAIIGSGGAAALAALSACAMMPGDETTCTDQGPNAPGWPYCAPSDPGGPGPADDPIDPTGRS